MPIYEYRCKKCETEFECLVLGGDNDVACPDCQALLFFGRFIRVLHLFRRPL
jgi:putative FmdB family regulatory protein